MQKRASVILSFLLLMIVYVSCNESSSTEKPKKKLAQYTGSASCKNCHEEDYTKWEDSHHFQSMLPPTEEYVLGDFNTSVILDGVEYTFYKSNDIFRIRTVDHGETSEYQVVYTFGFYPLQQYLVEFPDGKLQTLRATWDSENNKWFHQYADREIKPHDWLHWTNQSQNWNSMCADCHSTDLNKGYDVQSEKYRTTFAEVNVSCETCHGPGSVHIEWAESKENGEEYELAHQGLYPSLDNSIEFIEQCAPCHARRTMVVSKTKFNKPFYDQFFPQVLSDDFYEPDGQILEEDYVYTSFASSKMYGLNVNCINCHDPHSYDLKMEGNQLCLQCHLPAYDDPGHHFHKKEGEGGQCINCHMDGKFYMGNDYRRDHSFRNPRPDQSVKYGTSNACISCHDDKSNEWAAEAVVKWYGPERKKHFSDLLLKGRQDQDVGSLLQLARDSSYPAIARATAIRYLASWPYELYQDDLMPWSKEEDPIIRVETLRLISNLPGEFLLPISIRLLKDEYRAVRILAFMNLEAHYENLTLDQRATWLEVEKEFRIFLDYNADFREGQNQIAQYELGKGNVQEAVYALEKSISIDSLFSEPYTNLAILYSQKGENDKALDVLNALIGHYPEYDYAFYLRGLLKVEMNQLEGAILDVTRAIEIRPVPNYYYNLVLMWERTGQIGTGRKILREAKTLFPDDERIQKLNI